MSQEVFQLIKEMDLENMKIQLALQCAPVLSYKKIANLLIVSNHKEKLLQEFIEDTGLIYFKLLQTERRTTYLIFWKEELEEYLLQKDVNEFFDQIGYQSMDMEYVLSMFAKRYTIWNRTACEFPHEMGLLLGYPIDDVKGFIIHQGRNFLYSGYWKVYQEVEKKKALFETYEMATTEVTRMVYQGSSIREIVAYYQMNRSA